MTDSGGHRTIELDAITFAAWQRGDEEAVRRVIVLYNSALIAFLISRTGSRELAEDLAQDVFLLSLQKRPAITGANHLGPWLFSTGRHLAWNAMKKKSYRSEVSSDSESAHAGEPSMPASQSARYLTEQTRELLLEALGTLSDRERDIISLRFFAHFGIKEISEETGIPAGSVGTTMNRGMQKIRVYIEERGLNLGDLIP